MNSLEAAVTQSSVNLFEFDDYKSYLVAIVGPRDTRNGLRGMMAKGLKCQNTYISQVLYGNPNLSIEQALELSHLLGHSGEEEDYFLNLVLKARAGSRNLEKVFEKKINKAKADRMILSRRLNQNNVLSVEQQSRYYSSWVYSALHIAATIPNLNSVEKLSQSLGLKKKVCKSALDFLVECQLLERSYDLYVPSCHLIRIGKDSPNLLKHHKNCRLLAMSLQDNENPGDLSYSSVVSLSEKDALNLKKQFLNLIESFLKTVLNSPSEKLCLFNLDFLNLSKD